MSSKLAIDIDSALLDIEVLTEKARVMLDDIKQSYFDWDIENSGENMEDTGTVL